MPMEFNKDTKGYRYSKAKGTKFNETHGFVFGDTTFDVFYAKMRAYWDTNSIKVAAKTLSDEEKQFSKRKALAALLNGWASAGLTFAEVEVMLFNAKKGITNTIVKPTNKAGVALDSQDVEVVA
jgi:predicted nucleotide-binding protein (sugar kinase/HSP70/actin superfamily)